jgi:hypothetical protein
MQECRYPKCQRRSYLICSCEEHAGEAVAGVHGGECALAMLHLQQVEIAKLTRFVRDVKHSLRVNLDKQVAEAKKS